MNGSFGELVENIRIVHDDGDDTLVYNSIIALAVWSNSLGFILALLKVILGYVRIFVMRGDEP